MAANCTKDMRFFVISLGILLFFDVLAAVYLRSAFTTIERRFGLSTTRLALMSAAYQVGNLAVVVFVSYYGSRSHRPRFIAFGSGLVALGYFISSLPQFIGDRYEYVDATKGNDSTFKSPTCSSENANMSSTSCDDLPNSTNGGSNQYIFIVVGTLLCGIGSAPLQPLGMSYIDDYSEKRKSPVYIGAVMTITLIGPAFGYLLGSAVLRIWVDIGWVDSTEITISPKDHNWVGAWWLGTLLCGILVTISTIPLCFFPRKMKITNIETNATTEKALSDEKGESTVETDYPEANLYSRGKWGIFSSTKGILSDGVFILMLLIWVFGGLSIVGVITFFPKYLEIQFGVSASVANMYYGAIGIPCLAVGTLLGSFIMKRLNPDLSGMAKIMMVVRVVTTIISLSYLFIGCDTVDITGVNAPYDDSVEESETSTVSYCNLHCNCNEGLYAPICGADGMSYLSPCHAGCNNTFSTTPGFVQNYTDCACINPQSADKRAHWSYPGLCESTRCSHYAMVVLGIIALASFIGGIAATPSYVFLMRIVPQKEKAYAIGLGFMIARLLAWLPGPLLYGKIIDSTCEYWTASGCGNKGYCRVYDNDSFRFRYFGMQTCAEIAASFCAIAVYVKIRRRMKSAYHKNDGTTKAEKEILLKEPCNSKQAAARLASTSSNSSENLELRQETCT